EPQRAGRPVAVAAKRMAVAPSPGTGSEGHALETKDSPARASPPTTPPMAPDWVKASDAAPESEVSDAGCALAVNVSAVAPASAPAARAVAAAAKAAAPVPTSAPSARAVAAASNATATAPATDRKST